MAAHSVLVVDDSPIDRKLAGAMLTKRGFEVRYASDGLLALAAVAEAQPDVVVTDLHMPEMDGLELVQALRKTLPSLPIVLMTAHGSENTAVLALQKGASSFVPKRRLARDLADTVASLIEIAFDGDRISSVDPFEVGQVSFELGPDMARLGEIVGQLETQLAMSRICDESAVMQVGVALREALVNAVVHGNLEVSSSLLEGGGSSFAEAIDARKKQLPYSQRMARITAEYLRDEVRYVIKDEGPGFDPSTLPDPLDLSNLEKSSGRGLLLIRMFMDEIAFSERGNEIVMIKRRAAPASSS